MNKQLKTLKYLLSGILVLALATTTHAQTTGNPGDSTMHHRNGMHRGFDRQNFGRNQGFAQRGFHGGSEAHGRFNREHIRYTPDQRKQIAEINKDFREKSAALYKQDNLTLKQYKAGLLALQKDKKDKIGALLTQQQKDELAAGRKRMDENRQVREAAHLERLKLHLNLTDDQVAKIKAGNENLRTQAKAIHENDALLPEQKREQMKTLMAKRTDNYKSVLTPDQYSQFEKMMSHRQTGGRRHFMPDAAGSRAI